MRCFWLFLLCLGTLAARPATQPAPPAVFVLPLHGPIDKSLMIVFRRAFREVERLAPAAVILDINTPGGSLQETRELINWIRSSQKKGCPVYAYVNPDALSAGALTALACNAIFMADTGCIGSAMPIALAPFGGGIQELPQDIKEKMMSAVRALAVGLAQENGYRPEVALAMVDPQHPDLLFGTELISPKGQLLNLTARDAVRTLPGDPAPLLARAIATSLDGILDNLRLNPAQIVHFREEQADRLARWLTSLGPLLFGAAILLLWIEFKTPGFGVFGFSGVALLVLFMFGHHIAGLAGLEEVLLIMIGAILLAVEIFITPGFGAPGIIGILAMLTGAGMALIPNLPAALPIPGVAPLHWTEHLPVLARWLLLTTAVIAAGALLLARLLKRQGETRMILKTELAASQGYVSAPPERHALVGLAGIASTDLRPAGRASIAGQRCDVVSSGDFIKKGSPLRVISANGSTLMVETAEPERLTRANPET